MPANVRRINRLWRIVGPDGKVELTAKGKPRDGGGHPSKEVAMSQARAMNAPRNRLERL